MGPRSVRFTPGKETLVPIVQEAGWATGWVWTIAADLNPHRDSIPGPSSGYIVRAIENVVI
jgi:hypothetical protein